jgi:hypothetical protein
MPSAISKSTKIEEVIAKNRRLGPFFIGESKSSSNSKGSGDSNKSLSSSKEGNCADVF